MLHAEPLWCLLQAIVVLVFNASRNLILHIVVGGGDVQAGPVVTALILEDHGAAAVADAAVCVASGGWRDEGDEARRVTECG